MDKPDALTAGFMKYSNMTLPVPTPAQCSLLFRDVTNAESFRRKQTTRNIKQLTILGFQK
jgi:hypothetical protein